MLTNDELFYDPSMDANDQKWVDRQRQRYQPSRETVDPTKFSSGSSVKPLPRSDAVLNCPACMSLLCLDCQRYSQMYLYLHSALYVGWVKLFNSFDDDSDHIITSLLA